MKLLKLPEVAFDEVMKFWDVPERIELSTLSKRAACSIRRTFPSPPFSMRIGTGEKTKIGIYNKNSAIDPLFVWRVSKKKYSKKAKVVSINNIGETRRTPTSTGVLYVTSYKRKDQYKVSLNAIMRHLFWIFPKLTVEELTLEGLGNASYDLNHGLAAVKKVADLWIETEYVTKDAAFLIENVTVERKFICKAERTTTSRMLEDRLHCSDFIKSNNSRWLHPTRLQSLNCIMVSLHSSKITHEDFESFIRDWKTSTGDKYSRLKFLSFEMTSNVNRINLQQFGAVPYDQKRRPTKFVFPNSGNEINCLDTLDILRKDGTVGSVSYTGCDSVSFYVWPNQSQQ